MSQAVVTNAIQLQDAVTDPNVNLIYLGADIVMDTAITIPANKESLIFDGLHEEVRHRLTDVNSNSSTDTLGVRARSDIELTFRNMDMTGRNHFGIPYISGDFTSNVKLSYQNISYSGPQLVFNPVCLTRFENCDINILSSDASPAGEVGEVCKVEFAGNNVIRHNAEQDPTKAVFWFRGNIGDAYFKLLENAKLNVITTNYFMYNAIGLVVYPTAYEIQSGASFTLTSNTGFSYGSLHYMSSFLVDTDAVFSFTQLTSNDSRDSIYIHDGLTINNGATFYMQADFNSARPLIHFTSGTAAEISITNPKSFVLYNKVSAPIVTSVLVSRRYNIVTEQLNHWTAATPFPQAGTSLDTPPNKWYNTNNTVFTMSGILSTAETTADAVGLTDPHPPYEYFSYQTAKVISAGSPLIIPDPVVDNGRAITGLTEPFANLIISFTIDGREEIFDNITANHEGRFILDPNMQIPIGTLINIQTNTPFLIKSVNTTVVSAGELTIEQAPERITFTNPPISTEPILLRRFNPSVSVDILDSRPYLTSWKLYAAISGPLQSPNGNILENAVVYKDADNTLWELSAVPVEVHTGVPKLGTTEVTWPENGGILLRLTQAIRSGTAYTTQLMWFLEALDEDD